MDLATVKQFFNLEIDEAVLLLITITHPQIEPVRVVNNAPAEDGSGDIISRGERYIAFPFMPELPNNTDEQPKARITIANVDRRISESLANLDSSPLIAFEIITASNPDNVLMRFPRFELVNVTWDAVQVQGDLTQGSYASEPYGSVRVIPSLFPALYRS